MPFTKHWKKKPSAFFSSLSQINLKIVFFTPGIINSRQSHLFFDFGIHCVLLVWKTFFFISNTFWAWIIIYSIKSYENKNNSSRFFLFCSHIFFSLSLNFSSACLLYPFYRSFVIKRKKNEQKTIKSTKVWVKNPNKNCVLFFFI